MQIANNPPSMHADEADTGYTALSLIKTGQDPYGNRWPLHFQDQANNYRAPLYTYSVIPFVFLFGLNPVATRLPSVIFGTLMVLLVYLISKKMFKSDVVSITAALLVCINPWSIHLSRTGLEVNLSVFLTVLGFLLFLFRDKSKWYLFLSAIIFGLSLFSYHPDKIFTPLILLLLLILNYKDVVKNKGPYLLFAVIFAFFVGLTGYLAIFSNGSAEFGSASIFNNDTAYNFVNYQRTQTNAPLGISSIFANKPIYYIREFINKYIGPLSINYLFVNGEGSLDKGIGNYGQFHLFELFPLVLGIIYLWKRSKKYFVIFTVWFLFALIPGGITKNGYYAYRDVNAMFPPLIFTSLGIKEAINFLERGRRKYFLYIYAAFSLILFTYFVYNYYFSYPVYARDWWAYNQKQVIEYINKNKSKYSSVYIQGGMDWNILYAFYTTMDPREFQKSYKYLVPLGDKKVTKIDGIFIGDLTKSDSDISKSLYLTKQSLLVVPGHYFPKMNPYRSFYSVDGTHIDLNAFVIK